MTFDRLLIIFIATWASHSLADTEPLSLPQRFADHLKKTDSFDQKARSFVIKLWEDRDENTDTESFVAESLAVLSSQFADGLDAYDDEDYAAATEIMSALSDHEDPYLSTNAHVFHIKAMIEQGRVEEAGQLVVSALEDAGQFAKYTTFEAELAYLRGYCELHTLQYDEAKASFLAFLNSFPNASQRLTAGASTILAEINRRQPERISDVTDLMLAAGRRLDIGETGDVVIERQQRAIDLLDKLIEEAEQQEQSSSSSDNSSENDQQDQNQNQNQPNKPLEDSKLFKGDIKKGPLRASKKATPGESWGNLPPAEREKILQALRESFPSRYRQLVEQYYQELSKEP
jgi:tetratricopeptide (TPR) repeat protein